MIFYYGKLGLTHLWHHPLSFYTHTFLKEVRDTLREIKVIMGKNGNGGELTLLDKWMSDEFKFMEEGSLDYSFKEGIK